MEEQKRCFYLDSDFQPASDMLRKCVGDNNSQYRFNCGEDPMRQVLPSEVKETARMNDISIQRGITEFHVSDFEGDNVITRPKVSENNTNQLIDINLTEGFQNKSNIFVTDNGPGKSSVQYDQCPEGYSRCHKTGKCIQKCIGCVYRDNMKSREFNEADPCFPQGVYDGVTVDGDIKCTCGDEDKYCSERFVNQFTAEGSFSYNNKTKNTIGLTDSISKLFYFGQL